jgi:hypothetical protein
MRRQQLINDQRIISHRRWLAQLVLLVAWAWFCSGRQLTTAQEEAPKEPKSTESKETNVREPIYDPKANAKEQVDAALKLAKRDNQRVLVKFGGNWCGWCFKLHDVFTKHDVIAPLIDNEYRLVLVDVDGNRDLLESYGKDNAEHGFPFLTVLDADGKVLVNQNTSDLEDGPKHDPKRSKSSYANGSPPKRTPQRFWRRRWPRRRRPTNAFSFIWAPLGVAGVIV